MCVRCRGDGKINWDLLEEIKCTIDDCLKSLFNHSLLCKLAWICEEAIQRVRRDLKYLGGSLRFHGLTRSLVEKYRNQSKLAHSTWWALNNGGTGAIMNSITRWWCMGIVYLDRCKAPRISSGEWRTIRGPYFRARRVLWWITLWKNL